MRAAGRVVAEMHAAIREAAKPGVTTAALDLVGRRVLEARGATSNFLGYHGFPAVICASVDEVVVHGIPEERPLREGAVLSIDCGAIVAGWHADAAFTMIVGGARPEASVPARTTQLLAATDAALDAAIAQMVPGGRLSDIGHAVQSTAEARGFGVIRDYAGHGIGTEMHEWPDVPNFGRPGRGPTLVEGAVLAIEPMLVVGGTDTEVAPDGWSVVTEDGALAAHAEHTVLIGPHGPEILTGRLPAAA